MPELSLEICIAIIDILGSGRRAGHWDDGCTGCDDFDTLKTCSLVCKAWYHHTIPHLWSSLVIDIQPPQQRSKDLRLTVRRPQWDCHDVTLPLAEVLDIFLSNPRIMTCVRHLRLIVPWNVEKHGLIATPEFFNFCKALAPLPRFSWEAEEFDEENICTSSGEVADDDDHPLGQIITSFCHSNTLTTFHFSGVVFPLDILKATPNLKDISFYRVVECLIPRLSNGTLSFQSLPFHLWRARFTAAESVYEGLIAFGDIFSQLDELAMTSFGGESRADENLATLVCLPLGTLRTLYIEITDTRAFTQGLLTHGPSLESFKAVESCSIRILDLDELVASQDQAGLLDTLAAAPEGLFSKLESLELHLETAVVAFFDTIFNPEHRAWHIAKHLLGPNGAPALKSITITVAWSKTDARFEDHFDEMIKANITSQCLEMLGRCVPRWEDDARNVDIILKAQEADYHPGFRTPI